ncbi:XdhC family protein [Flavobacteriaceae bacterium]|jgi:xanthine/CO dehydrogenase XdhC/CoxF family maturation factor|nr:XdhC family protein [Flavobacteriaceae bacterium]
MIHELKDIIRSAKIAQSKGIKTVLASVVSLDGSSYRRPGVRMSVQENGKMIGAVSGGCVEKEILRQAQHVFKTNSSILMEYDGRYRLGCEGILYILIEPFHLSNTFFDAFEKQCSSRKSFLINSYFSKETSERAQGSTCFHFGDQELSVSKLKPEKKLNLFSQTIKPGLKLIIIGCEHDAVQLCKYGSATGWEVEIVAPIDELKTIDDFPGAANYYGIHEKEFSTISIDSQTAVVIMSHSYVRDLKYLSELLGKDVNYIGLLGPSKRREKLLNDLIEKNDLISEDFFDKIYGPAGINIGAETPQEIAISILGEILSVIRNQKPIYLKDKQIGIHQ